MLMLLLVVGLAGPASAELTYTMRIEARKSSRPAAPPANPLMAMMGSLIVGAMAPPGGLEVVVTVGPRGTRVDYAQAYMIVPAGGATLMRVDGSMVVLDNVARTFWQTPKAEPAVTLSPVVTSRASGGETMTIAGVSADRRELEIRLPLPVPAGTGMPEGLPAEMVLTGEVWVSSRYKEYGRMASSMIGAFGAIGFDKIVGDGFLMRSVLRGEVFGDQEVESRVTAIGESTVAASTFESPAGYAEVPVPVVSMPGR
jgi:hypothetical protein